LRSHPVFLALNVGISRILAQSFDRCDMCGRPRDKFTILEQVAGNFPAGLVPKFTTEHAVKTRMRGTTWGANLQAAGDAVDGLQPWSLAATNR
jgi:hypothetical protein